MLNNKPVTTLMGWINYLQTKV